MAGRWLKAQSRDKLQKSVTFGDMTSLIKNDIEVTRTGL
jgi:hypothetical protein